MTGDKAIRLLTAAVVLAVASFAAVVSYSHIDAPRPGSRPDGQLAARLLPLSVDGLILAAAAGAAERSPPRADRARAGALRCSRPRASRATVWPRTSLPGCRTDRSARCVSAWPAVAFVGSVEMAARHGPAHPRRTRRRTRRVRQPERSRRRGGRAVRRRPRRPGACPASAPSAPGCRSARTRPAGTGVPAYPNPYLESAPAPGQPAEDSTRAGSPPARWRSSCMNRPHPERRPERRGRAARATRAARGSRGHLLRDRARREAAGPGRAGVRRHQPARGRPAARSSPSTCSPSRGSRPRASGTSGGRRTAPATTASAPRSTCCSALCWAVVGVLRIIGRQIYVVAAPRGALAAVAGRRGR